MAPPSRIGKRRTAGAPWQAIAATANTVRMPIQAAKGLAARGSLAEQIVALHELLSQTRRAHQLTRNTKTLENLDELRRFGAAQEHLVLNTAQKRFVT